MFLFLLFWVRFCFQIVIIPLLFTQKLWRFSGLSESISPGCAEYLTSLCLDCRYPGDQLQPAREKKKGRFPHRGPRTKNPCPFGSSFGSCWGGAHQFCFSMDNILRNLESLSRTELVWLNTYLVGRLRALPPENDSHPAVPGIESPGSVAMQGPHGVTCQQDTAVAPLPDRIDASTPLWILGSAQGLHRKAGRLTSTRRWCRFRAISN